jgi:succinoglycan biosynthesis protein ExoV
MKLYYFHSEPGNFGDEINPWLWNKLIPDLLTGDDDTLFVGIGTLLNHRVPVEPAKVVFGSGAGYGDRPKMDEKWQVYCVRGPLTANELGLDPVLAITDSAALISTIALSPPLPDGGLAFMPHQESAVNTDWGSICETVGIRYIDPTWDVERVLSEIRRSSTVLTEAMHGAIVADALRVPWVPIVCYPHILDFKWRDWCESLRIDYSPLHLPGIWTVPKDWTLAARCKNQIKRTLLSLGAKGNDWTPPHPISPRRDKSMLIDSLGMVVARHSTRLSDARVFDDAVSRLLEALDQIRADFSPSRVGAKTSRSLT